MHVLVEGDPLIMLGLVCVQVVEDDVEFLFRWILRYDAAQEVEELPATTAVVVPRSNQPRCDLQRSGQDRSSMPLLVVAEPGQYPTIRETKVALFPLQHLDCWLLIYTQHYRVLRRS